MSLTLNNAIVVFWINHVNGEGFIRWLIILFGRLLNFSPSFDPESMKSRTVGSFGIDVMCFL